MNFFNQIYQKIFPNTENGNNPPIEVRETIKRNTSYLQDYQDWIANKSIQKLIEPIQKAYHFKKININSATQVHLLRSGGANGFAITYDPVFGKEAFQFLLDYWKDKIKTLNYQLQIAERRITEKKDYVETKEKYYLKPSIRLEAMQNKLCNQLYGNILLEYVQIDERPSYLKVLVTYYVDALFSEVLDYDDLVKILFEQDEESA